MHKCWWARQCSNKRLIRYLYTYIGYFINLLSKCAYLNNSYICSISSLTQNYHLSDVTYYIILMIGSSYLIFDEISIIFSKITNKIYTTLITFQPFANLNFRHSFLYHIYIYMMYAHIPHDKCELPCGDTDNIMCVMALMFL